VTGRSIIVGDPATAAAAAAARFCEALPVSSTCEITDASVRVDVSAIGEQLLLVIVEEAHRIIRSYSEVHIFDAVRAGIVEGKYRCFCNSFPALRLLALSV